MDAPVKLGEARAADGALVLQGAALRMLEGWLAYRRVDMTPAEYLSAGMAGTLPESLSAPYEALRHAF